MFVLQVQKSKINVDQFEILTSGSVNVHHVRFMFSESWDGLKKTAVFKHGREARSILLDDSEECIIPWEVLTHPGGTLYAGVYGTKDEEIVLPTVWAPLGEVREGVITDAEEPIPPTPSIYDQILARLDKKGDRLAYENSILSLLSGETELSSVPIVGGGGGDLEFATDEEVEEMLDDVFND